MLQQLNYHYGPNGFAQLMPIWQLSVAPGAPFAGGCWGL